MPVAHKLKLFTNDPLQKVKHHMTGEAQGDSSRGTFPSPPGTLCTTENKSRCSLRCCEVAVAVIQFWIPENNKKYRDHLHMACAKSIAKTSPPVLAFILAQFTFVVCMSLLPDTILS